MDLLVQPLILVLHHPMITIMAGVGVVEVQQTGDNDIQKKKLYIFHSVLKIFDKTDLSLVFVLIM